MGLSLHYKGRLNRATDLASLLLEVKEIAIINNWKYHVFDEKFTNNRFSNTIEIENLFGISINPPGSEPFCFTFLSNGFLCGIMQYSVMKMDNNIDKDMVGWISVKTQYAGFEFHKKLVILLGYLSKKYLSNFECKDEGYYWETRNEALLKKTFTRYENLIESFTESLSSIVRNENESLEDYLIRIANFTQKNNNIL
jgi:hypothetical protein